MTRTIAIASLMLAIMGIASSTHAQQPLQSAAEQAMSQKLIAEISENVQLRAALIDAQKQIADLKAKYEPAKEAPTK